MSTTDQSPKPKLHWLRYKLKTLLLVMLVAGQRGSAATVQSGAAQNALQAAIDNVPAVAAASVLDVCDSFAANPEDPS